MEENMSKKVLIIIIAVFVLLMGMMGAGFFLLWSQMSATVAQVQNQNGEPEEPEKDAAVEENAIGTMYQLGTLIVNLADHGGKRYLRVTMELELKPNGENEPAEVIEEIEKRLPQLRDSILMILPTKQYDEISTTAGKISLRDELMAKLNAFLKIGQISKIYFTEFVVQ